MNFIFLFPHLGGVVGSYERRHFMNQEQLQKRVKQFIGELNLPISRLAKNIGFDRSTYYKWLKGEKVFSETTLKKIDNYLKTYGF